MIKYCLHPGYIISQNDGDKHYIGARKLARLYGVQLDECYIVDTSDRLNLYQMIDPDNVFTHLYPDYKGNYKVPEA